MAIHTAHAVLAAQAPLVASTTRITITGTSNIHDYTASTNTMHIIRSVRHAEPGATEDWSLPGSFTVFEVAIPAATLTSPREGLDKNMHKALKVGQFSDITFKLLQFTPKDEGHASATALLTIAGVERNVAFEVAVSRSGSALTVRGELPLLMTDYGIAPPKAMLGMLKTDPHVTVTFETVLTVPTT